MLGRHLQIVLNNAVMDVRRRRHEFLTLEHVLFAMTQEAHGRMLIEGCGANAAVLREQLQGFFQTHMEVLSSDEAVEIIQTEGVQRVLDNALLQIRSAGRELVELGDVLAAIMDEEDTFAFYYLRKQGVSRLDVLQYISHSIDMGNGSTGVGNDTERRAELDGESATEDAGQDALEKFTVDLTARAKAGELDPLVGREAELDRTVEVLCRRRKNNPLFVGEPGVGKTAMAEGLALRIAQGNVPAKFKDVHIFSLDMGSLLAGARYRGDFEGRMKAVIAAVRNIPNAIIFIDEIHTIVGAGATSGGAMDASNLLKPILAAGEVRCIGSTTYEEFRNHLEKDRALSRRFQRIDIREPSVQECLDILKGLSPRYEKHHQVRYPVPVLKAAVELSARHVQERLLPDKAIDVMDEAGAAVSLRPAVKKGCHVSLHDIERIVARMAGIPERSVSGREKTRLATLEHDMLQVVYGQDEAVALTVRAILRSRAGIGREDRPAGSFLFYGPTGVGKTELARRLADLLGINFLRYDMSEYMEKHAVSRLIGAPPGYVGFDQGGLLTEAIRKAPYSLVLLDEVEKAHPDIFDVLLQVMDYGTLTDNTGRKADFRNVIVIMTSNAGAREMARTSIGFGEASPDNAAGKALKAVENTFSPEF
ncbi:MAG: AAA family ATPase, partial [Desulfovibrionaceae bacterium]